MSKTAQDLRFAWRAYPKYRARYSGIRDDPELAHLTVIRLGSPRSVRAWLADNLAGEFSALRGLGGPGREHEHFAERLAWNRHLAVCGWTCLGWPAEHGGRAASLAQQVIFH